MSVDADDIVTRFCAAWSEGNLDHIMSFFAADAVYHNIPLAPVTGVDAIRATIESFVGGVDKVEFRVQHQAGAGNVVMNERVDAFMSTAKTIELPVMGVFEIDAAGKISAWRDYFDMNQFTSQMSS